MKKKTAYFGIFIALALIFSYVESFISIGIPGIKLGLANVVIVLVLYTIGPVDAIIISVIRILLVGFLFGNAFSIIYSLAGGLLSFLVMYLIKKTGKLKCISVSMIGGVTHNIGQIVVAAIIVNNYYVMYYVPVLLIAGVITGLFIGIVTQEVIIRLGDRIKF